MFFEVSEEERLLSSRGAGGGFEFDIEAMVGGTGDWEANIGYTRRSTHTFKLSGFGGEAITAIRDMVS